MIAAPVCLGVFAFLSLLAVIDRVPYVDDDETLWASAAYELMRSGRAVPSVLAEYPEASRFDLFYGPAGFRLGAAAFRIFGFAITSFRILSLFGAVLLAAAGAWLVRVLGGSVVAACVCFALIALSPEVGFRATGGRTDALAVGCLVAGLALSVKGSQVTSGRRYVWSVAAGAAWSLAVLAAAPRSLPFFAALGVGGAATALLSHEFRRRVLPGLIVGLCVASVGVAAWLAGEGMTPTGWLRYLSAVSYGDRFNASPLLGGELILNPSPHTLLTPLVLCVIACVLIYAFARERGAFTREGDADGCRLTFASGVVALNCLFTLALISRHFYYGIYWALPLLPVAVAATSRFIRDRNRRLTAATVLLALSWGGLAAGYVMVRAAKFVEVTATWEARDPRRVERFVRENVPSGSDVYGPQRYFFYAVERAGSSYLYVDKWTTAGLADAVPGFEHESHTAVARRRGAKRFLLWEANKNLPPRFTGARFVARLPRAVEGSPWLTRFSPGGEHPVFDLYEVADGVLPANNVCVSKQGDASHMLRHDRDRRVGDRRIDNRGWRFLSSALPHARKDDRETERRAVRGKKRAACGGAPRVRRVCVRGVSRAECLRRIVEHVPPPSRDVCGSACEPARVSARS